MTDQIHPDEAARRIDRLAREMGYGVTSLTLIGLEPVAGECPEHRYGKADAHPVTINIRDYDRDVLPARVHQIMSDPRRHG